MSAVFWRRESPLPRAPLVADRSVHVWCASLEDPPLPLEEMLGVLTTQERSTAGQYRFQRDVSRSIASRGLLRWLLGAYLGLQPERVPLRTGRHGKLELTGAFASSGLNFNVAHSDGIVLYGVTRDREIGVDIERVRPMPDAEDIARHFFAVAEVRTLTSLAPEQVDESFFVCWTRKEAYVKALGGGLTLPLHDFEVSLHRGEGSDGLTVPSDPAQATIWSLYDVSPLPGFLGAVAVAERNLQLRRRWWV